MKAFVWWNSQENLERNRIYSLLSENYNLQKQYKKALEYYQLKTSLKDSIDNIHKSRQLEEIKTTYEVNKKEQQNLFLEKENALAKLDNEVQRKTITTQNTLMVLLLASVIILLLLLDKIAQQRKRLRIANQTKDMLFNIVSHDLRGPVSHLETLTDLIIEANSNPEYDQHLKNSKIAIGNTFTMLNDLLIWSTSQKDEIKLNPVDTYLKQLVKKATVSVNHLITKKEIEVIIDIDEKEIGFVDENAIRSVFRNLISNAIKFTPRGGIVKIKSSKLASKNVHQIEVSDNGVGMDEKQVDQLFSTNKFKTSLGTENEVGSGIGLLICKDILHKSNGEIWAQSQVNKGTSIYFTLPSAESDN